VAPINSGSVPGTIGQVPTLGILKSLYPRADFNTMGDDFVVTCTDDEASKIVEDSTLTADHIVDMHPVDMS
jgi:hypothetical protein